MADAVGTAEVAPGRVVPVLPDLGYEHQPSGHLLAPQSLEMERSMLGVRTELALAYARENGVNRIEGARDAWLGIVAPGKSYTTSSMPCAASASARPTERAGIRILKLGMISPLEGEIVTSSRAARGDRRHRGEAPVRRDRAQGDLYGARMPAVPRQARRARRAPAPLTSTSTPT